MKEKVDLALANGLKVIFCIGESLAQREAGEQEAVCKAELEGSVFHLSAEQWKNVVIAYEPIWAIGTGKTATAEQAEEIHAFIRKCVADQFGAEAADATSILYGGSCKASNAPELFAKPTSTVVSSAVLRSTQLTSRASSMLGRPNRSFESLFRKQHVRWPSRVLLVAAIFF